MTATPLPPLPYAAGFEKVEYPMLELQILALQSDRPRRFRRPKAPSQILKQFLLA